MVFKKRKRRQNYNEYDPDNDQASLKEVDVDAFQDVREELARKCSKKSKPEELSVYSIYGETIKTGKIIH